MSEYFSDMAKNEPYVKPEEMWVVKASNRSYPAFWNKDKEKWVGLLDATIYYDKVEPGENAETVDYREIVGIK